MSETLRYLQSESADKGVEIGVLVKYLLVDAVKAGAASSPSTKSRLRSLNPL